MKRKSRLVFTVSLFIVSLFFLICISAWFILSIFSGSIEDSLEKVYRTQAQSVGEQIGSQFFERYGDAQAMAQSAGLLMDSPQASKKIGLLLNSYARLYRLYDFIMVVDTRGRIIAVNSEDAMGKPLKPAMLSSLDVLHSDWYQKPLSGAFTDDPERSLQGTYFYLKTPDPDMEKIYKDSSPRALFSAVIVHNQKTAGVVVTHARLDWLTRQVQELYDNFLKLGMGASGIRVVDGEGHVLASFGDHDGGERLSREGIFVEAPIESSRFPTNLNWRVQVFSPRSDVRHFVQYWKVYYILLASLLFAASVIVTFYLGRKFKDLSQEYEEAIEDQHKLEDRVKERTQALEHNVHELKIMQERVVAQEKLAGLGVMATGLAHEIKNPLNIVLNSAQFLKDHYLERHGKTDAAEARQFADMIVKHSERIDALVKAILLSARKDSGETRVVVDVNELITESLQVCLKTFQIQHQVNVPSELKASAPSVRVRVDIEDLRRVLLNLIDNALYSLWKKWGPDNMSQASLKIRVEAKDGMMVATVEDNGLGISQEEGKSIFTPFFTTKAPGQGTGLGLSMSLDLMRKYGGDITFESEKNAYCRFFVRLPLYIELPAST